MVQHNAFYATQPGEVIEGSGYKGEGFVCVVCLEFIWLGCAEALAG